MTDPNEQERKRKIHRAFQGDADAFRLLVVEYQRPVYNLCHRYVGESDAEDIAQEAFIRAFVNKEKFDPNRGILPWLLTVARNLCVDRIRQTKRLDRIEPSALEQTASKEPLPDAAISDKQLLSMVEETLQSLPEGRREVLMLVDVEGMSYQETADVLKVPIGTVMTWLHRGRERIRELISKKQMQKQRRLSNREVTV